MRAHTQRDSRGCEAHEPAALDSRTGNEAPLRPRPRWGGLRLDLMQRAECTSEADHASLENLWMQLGSRKLGRPFTKREHRERWLVSQKARFERFDVPGLARP